MDFTNLIALFYYHIHPTLLPIHFYKYKLMLQLHYAGQLFHFFAGFVGLILSLSYPILQILLIASFLTYKLIIPCHHVGQLFYF
mmetsp:Transcript_6662/g.838  ORF Transcript_6662/g.838 Transcript_6662/m.838 type:complete len:84 (-) Transcript_6662:19-270(-)